MAGISLLAWNNFVLTSGLTASSAAMPVSNLTDERGSSSVAWQTVGPSALLTITPSIKQQTWRVFGLFRTNLTPFATITVTLYSGDLSAPLLTWTGGADGPEPGYGQAITIAGSDVVADYCTIQIDDPGNPQGFLNIPLAYAGPAWIPETSLSYDTTFGVDPTISSQVARGGQEYLTFLYSQRRAELAFYGFRHGEIMAQLAELQRTAARGPNVLVVPDVTSPTFAMEAIYGRVVATADVAFPYAAADRRSWKARVTERL